MEVGEKIERLAIVFLSSKLIGIFPYTEDCSPYIKYIGILCKLHKTNISIHILPYSKSL